MTGPAASSIASFRRAAYGRLMVALRLLRFLTLVALLVAPLKMISAHAETAMPTRRAAANHMAAAMPAGHCDDTGQPDHSRPDASIDCAMACSAMPSADGELVAHPQPIAPVPPPDLTDALVGLHPESDPPPPRFA